MKVLAYLRTPVYVLISCVNNYNIDKKQMYLQLVKIALFVFQGFKSQALAVTCDPEHKFELALQLGDLRVAYQLAKEAEVSFYLNQFLTSCANINKNMT